MTARRKRSGKAGERTRPRALRLFRRLPAGDTAGLPLPRW